MYLSFFTSNSQYWSGFHAILGWKSKEADELGFLFARPRNIQQRSWNRSGVWSFRDQLNVQLPTASRCDFANKLVIPTKLLTLQSWHSSHFNGSLLDYFLVARSQHHFLCVWGRGFKGNIEKQSTSVWTVWMSSINVLLITLAEPFSLPCPYQLPGTIAIDEFINRVQPTVPLVAYCFYQFCHI